MAAASGLRKLREQVVVAASSPCTTTGDSSAAGLLAFAASLAKIKSAKGDGAKCVRLVHYFLQRGLRGAPRDCVAAVRGAMGMPPRPGKVPQPAGELAHAFLPRQMLAWRTLARACATQHDAADFMQLVQKTRIFDAVSRGEQIGAVSASSRKGGLLGAGKRAKERKSRSDDVYALPFIFSAVRVACCDGDAGSAALLRPQLASAQGGAVCATLLSTCVHAMSSPSRDAARHAAQTVLACCRSDAQLAAQCAGLLAPSARAIVEARSASAAGLLLPDRQPRLNLESTIAAVAFLRICAALATGSTDPTRVCFVDVLVSTLLPRPRGAAVHGAAAARSFRVQMEAAQLLLRIFEWHELEALRATSDATSSVATLLLSTLTGALAEQRRLAPASPLPPVLTLHAVGRVAAMVGREARAKTGAEGAKLCAELQTCFARNAWINALTRSSNQLLRLSLLDAIVWLFHLDEAAKSVAAVDGVLVNIERIVVSSRQCGERAHARRVQAALICVVRSLIARLRFTVDVREAVMLLRICFQLSTRAGSATSDATGDASSCVLLPPGVIIEACDAVVELLGADGQVRRVYSFSFLLSYFHIPLLFSSLLTHLCSVFLLVVVVRDSAWCSVFAANYSTSPSRLLGKNQSCNPSSYRCTARSYITSASRPIN